MSPPFSVIVNTLDRADALRNVLVALRRLTYPSFEVIVVAGPCSDHTADVMAEFDGEIKARWCPERNLSMSRNIGIAAAAGDLVAFIDDDGIPEQTWLEDLAAMYSLDEVAAVGGVVHDHTGYDFQTRFILCDRLGAAEYSDTTPFDAFSFPGSMKYPTVLGCNSSFRRSALIEVGGFDEEFEYYLDETDVCVRLVDAGFVVRQSPVATVHHKFLPSGVRDHHRVVLNNYPIIKNAIYFSMVNGSDHLTRGEIYSGAAVFAERRVAELDYHAAHGRVTDAQRAEALALIESGWAPGIAAGERGRVAMYHRTLEDQHGGEFLPYPTIRSDGRRLRICLVTQTLPPAVPGGIGRYCLDLGRELAARGHDVRIITDGVDHSTVDLEDGVWIHRIVKRSDREVDADGPVVPAPIWAKSAAVADEVLRLQRERPVDVVYAPIWDAEGFALGAASSVLTITALMTTMGISLQNRPSWSEDADFMATLGDPLHELERRQLAGSHGLHAISAAIVDEIEAASGVAIDDSGLFTSHLGVVDTGDDEGRSPNDGDVVILFVGRFERRKGIDLLFGAIPTVLAEHPGARFVLIGRDDLPGDHGRTYREDFEALHPNAPWWDRVEFRGEAPDDEVAAAYRACDIFVAPSRFESFGLIYVEAMMSGAPVVAVRTGAAPEVVGDDGAAGVLVDADPAAIAGAVGALVADPQRRAALARSARQRYLDHFTIETMTDAVERDLRSCITIRPGDAQCSGGGAAVVLSDDTVGVSLDSPVTVDQRPAGRATVVLAADRNTADGAAAGAVVEISIGDRHLSVEPPRTGFGHFTLPATGDGTGAPVTLRTRSGRAVFAALHVVPGRGRTP